ncbi:hypothetical protein, partial [Acinetobacter baumannii]
PRSLADTVPRGHRSGACGRAYFPGDYKCQPRAGAGGHGQPGGNPELPADQPAAEDPLVAQFKQRGGAHLALCAAEREP